MAYKYWIPVAKTEVKLKLRDILKFLAGSFNGRDGLMTEYGATAEPEVSRRSPLMPLTGERWAHAEGGWGVCDQFYLDNVQRFTKLRKIPRSNGTVRTITTGDTVLTRRDVRDLEIAFGGNMALLFAVSILTNQVLTIDARALLTGGINGSLEEPKRTIWARRGTKRLPRDSGLAFMLEPTKTEQAIGAKGPQGNAQVDTRIKWERDTMCAMDEATAGVWSVADLGLDSVTVYLHFALLHDSRQRVVRIRERESWGSFTFG